MTRNVCPLFVICVISSLVQLGWGLDCYKCSTIYYEDCNDLQDISKAEVELCPQNGGQRNFCAKYTFSYDNKKMTQRSCATVDDCNLGLEMLKSMYSIDVLKSCDFCTGKLCNSATNVDVTVTYVVALLTTVCMLL
ncbi:uncharacterized protein LOC106665009 [Cimex lectularius]|uniref:Protein sleepless n=1 Tax=Cimex lectularius TaxID=79782 RepID=A0A8I6RNE3_CIMLE|nr:uncharacterized protein LOC106665009 [Cimex lectularius]